MKFTVTMKNPDALYESVRDAIGPEKEALVEGGMAEDEADAIVELREAKATKLANLWLRYGEYLDVEFDTDAGTATLLKGSR